MGEIKPSHLLNHLATQDEEGNYTPIYPEWKGAVQALINAVEAGDTWEVLTYNDGDWFLDGDKEGFSRAVSMHLTLLMDLKYLFINIGSMLFSSLQFENEYDFENNTYSQGSYENIVHILRPSALIAWIPQPTPKRWTQPKQTTKRSLRVLCRS